MVLLSTLYCFTICIGLLYYFYDLFFFKKEKDDALMMCILAHLSYYILHVFQRLALIHGLQKKCFTVFHPFVNVENYIYNVQKEKKILQNILSVPFSEWFWKLFITIESLFSCLLIYYLLTKTHNFGFRLDMKTEITHDARWGSARLSSIVETCYFLFKVIPKWTEITERYIYNHSLLIYSFLIVIPVTLCWLTIYQSDTW